MKTVKRIVMTAAIAASATTGAWAIQEAEAELGSVTGRIMDSEKHVLPGASVIVEDLHTGVTTDINGYYKLPVLKPGTYTLKISYVGYAPIIKKITVNDKKSQVNDFIMSEGHALKEIEVQGALSGQRRALQMQKSGMGLTNVVSADQAGKFPDSNIGDALKRISGINVQYDQGEARFGQVRGTSADLTSVTVNGNRLPSAEGDTRNVQLDLIPSDMIQTIEVNKVVTSDMDGDAIGGAINLVTKNTPYRRVLNFMVGTGYSWISGKPQWNLGATWGDRFFNNKLGIMASASYQYAPGGSDNTEFEYDTDGDGVTMKEFQVRQYYVTRERQSYSLALDYQFNPLNKVSFKGIYNRRNDWENRFRARYRDLDDDPGKQELVMETKAGANNTKNARLERQQTMDFTLDGEHYIGNLKIDWAASYSRATEERPNERYAAIKYSDVDLAGSLRDVGGRQPYSTFAIPGINDSGWEFDELTNQDEDIVENEYKARLNFELPLAKGRFGNALKFGGKYTYKDKSKDISFYEYGEELLGDWRTQTTPKIRDGFMPGNVYPIGSPFIAKEYLGGLLFNPALGTEVLEEEAGNYDVTEQVTAGYIRFDQKIGNRLDATVGLRVENTRLKTNGFNYQAWEDDNGDDRESLDPTGEYRHDYTNVLPSVLLKYKVNDDLNIRASFTETLSRPKYSALIANRSFNLSDREATIGDPNTKPTTSFNYDLSTEYYFKSVGLVSLGLFYKDIRDVNVETLGYYTGEELGLRGNTERFEVTQNMNAYDARIFGVEVGYQRDFGFISPALKCIGFYGNYTYTHSATRNYNGRLGIKDGDDVKMAGSPEHTANASLYFEKAGVNVRLSYNFASEFIDQMNTGARALDRYYDKVNYLDLNASYTWGKSTKFTVFAEAHNLLNQPLRYYQGEKDRTMQVEYYGVKVNAGFKINL